MTDRYDPNEFASQASAESTIDRNPKAEKDRASATTRASDMARLERGVRQLLEQLHATHGEADELRRRLEASDARIRDLEEELLASNQRRQDAVKRIDDLSAWVDRIIDGNAPGYNAAESRPAGG